MRARLAPCSTGVLPIEQAHIALFNWLLARHAGGTVVLRLESIVPDAHPEAAGSLDALGWMGLDWDEGPDVGGPDAPYVQSDRQTLYLQKAQELVLAGDAYACYCSEAELAAMRLHQQIRGLPPHYDRRCLSLYTEHRAAYEAEGRRPAIRFKVPEGCTVTFHDRLRGDVRVETAEIGDFVIVDREGRATSRFAGVIDDALMRITHVLRGASQLCEVPSELLIVDALGFKPPEFAHLPAIHGAEASHTGALRQAGILGEAFSNYLAMLGWAPPDEAEIMDLQATARVFELDRMNRSPAIFDREKLRWVNDQWRRRREQTSG